MPGVAYPHLFGDVSCVIGVFGAPMHTSLVFFI